MPWASSSSGDTDPRHRWLAVMMKEQHCPSHWFSPPTNCPMAYMPRCKPIDGACVSARQTPSGSSLSMSVYAIYVSIVARSCVWITCIVFVRLRVAIVWTASPHSCFISLTETDDTETDDLSSLWPPAGRLAPSDSYRLDWQCHSAMPRPPAPLASGKWPGRH